MTHEPETVSPGNPSRAMARLALSATAAHIADYARSSIVSTTGDQHLTPGEILERAQTLRGMMVALIDAAVQVERAKATPWATLASIRRLSIPEMQAAHPDARTGAAITASAEETLSVCRHNTPLLLDAWYAATAPPPQGEAPSRPVSGGLV